MIDSWEDSGEPWEPAVPDEIRRMVKVCGACVRGEHFDCVGCFCVCNDDRDPFPDATVEDLHASG